MLGVLEQVFSRGESMGFSFEKKKKTRKPPDKIDNGKKSGAPKSA